MQNLDMDMWLHYFYLVITKWGISGMPIVVSLLRISSTKKSLFNKPCYLSVL